ncbi:Cation diffusion facilitator 1 [Phytophthora palmivora]|uniref:Cation diffusion facilitator 1 n=1 Tax=Phytophthora palmivora TaxID=4796 RepID=A0A2P4YGV0_9STRA|nr:Cation diffusion facilitator 1 [Phytophthora palmivora]
MSKRSNVAAPQSSKPSKPSSTKDVELPRSIRPSHLKSSSRSHRNFISAPSCESTHSDDGNNSIPTSPHTSTRESGPATDEEAQLSPMHHNDPFQLDNAERQAVEMLNKITKRSERNHNQYDVFRDSISGTDKRIDELHASPCTGRIMSAVRSRDEMDADTLDKLFMALPLQQRQLYLGE